MRNLADRVQHGSLHEVYLCVCVVMWLDAIRVMGWINTKFPDLVPLGLFLCSADMGSSQCKQNIGLVELRARSEISAMAFLAAFEACTMSASLRMAQQLKIWREREILTPPSSLGSGPPLPFRHIISAEQSQLQHHCRNSNSVTDLPHRSADPRPIRFLQHRDFGKQDFRPLCFPSFWYLGHFFKIWRKIWGMPMLRKMHADFPQPSLFILVTRGKLSSPY